MKKDINFISINSENINQFRNLRKIFAKYKIKTLRNHGEAPGDRKMFFKLFDDLISRVSDSDSDYFLVMRSGKEIIGFTTISTFSKDFFDIPYNYGSVNDFYISPKQRRKGYGRILNGHIENIFKDNGTGTVMLFPDPVYGIPFWKAMGYSDTGFHHG